MVKTEQIHREMERSDLGSPETAIILAGTSYLKTTRNLDFVMGEVYTLAATVKKKHPKL